MATLEILREIVLCEVARGRDLLRVTRVEATVSGTPARWYSLRVFFRGESGWLPSRAGLTVRDSEVAAVVAALTGARDT